LLTCKEFLQEFSDYLDENVDAEIRAKLEQHIRSAPTVGWYATPPRKPSGYIKGMEPHPISPEIESRLMAALEKKMAARNRSPTFLSLVERGTRAECFRPPGQSAPRVQFIIHEDRAMIAHGYRTSLILRSLPVVNGILRRLERHAVGEDVRGPLAQPWPSAPTRSGYCSGARRSRAWWCQSRPWTRPRPPRCTPRH
jgi:hypothetical protein